MQTEAVFENIAERIQQEISKAQKSVFIAVAWFTNKNLFNELVNKARNGCTVSLIISNDNINLNSSIDFEQLLTDKSKVYKIGNGDTELMHNKFCVIDFSTVITGSYNWSYKAESNFENVIITSNDTTLAEQFICEFNNIRKQYYPDETKEEIVFPLNKIIKRLEILKNYILLEDIEELGKETSKLREYEFNSDLQEIIDDVRIEEFASAINKIQIFISKNQQLLIWTDPEIAALKLEIKNLENQLNAYDNEKIELEKLLSEFQHRHTIELGEIILDILKLLKLKFKSDKTKFEQAEPAHWQQWRTDWPRCLCCQRALCPRSGHRGNRPMPGACCDGCRSLRNWRLWIASVSAQRLCPGWPAHGPLVRRSCRHHVGNEGDARPRDHQPRQVVGVQRNALGQVLRGHRDEVRFEVQCDQRLPR